jgi:effector-binding domain-containing protein
MIETPRITEVPAQTMASIRLTVPTSEIQNVMGPGIQEVYAVLAEQGIKPSGAWFTHHFQRPSYLFNFEICVPTETPVAVSGRVRPGQLPAHKVARTIYSGPYEGLADAWGEFLKWIQDNNQQAAVELWERYLSGPETSSTPADWRTELNQPLL